MFETRNERERERESVCVCVCVPVWARARASGSVCPIQVALLGGWVSSSPPCFSWTDATSVCAGASVAGADSVSSSLAPVIDASVVLAATFAVTVLSSEVA